MLFTSLRARLGWIFFGFLVLVSASVAGTYYIAYTQRSDAVIINLAGRQRMLLQRMALLAVASPGSPEVEQAARSFEQTLAALRTGGEVALPDGKTVYLPAAPDMQMLAALEEVDLAWQDFHAALQTPDPAVLTELSTSLVRRMDEAVSEYQSLAGAKVAGLLWIQGLFMVAALALLSVGYLLVRRSILQPLAYLQEAAGQIGAGVLDQPVLDLGEDELGELGRAFEVMRQELSASHDLLETRVFQRTKEMAAAAEFSQEIVSSRGLQQLLQSVANRVRSLMSAERVSLKLAGGEADPLILTVDDQGSQQSQALLEVNPASSLVVPLQVGEEVLGALVVQRRSPPFDDDEQRALHLLANSTAIAITNVRLVDAEHQQASKSAALAERQRLAGELHDNLAQTLSFLRMKIERSQALLQQQQGDAALPELLRAQEAIDRAYCQVRAALVDLNEPPSTVEGLQEKIEACIEAFNESLSEPDALAIHLNMDTSSEISLPRRTLDQVVLILREALANIRLHAQASQVDVHAYQAGSTFILGIQDNGTGFDPGTLAVEHHLGIRIMRTRAERSGGSLHIHSSPGKGTQVVAHFPLDGKVQDE